MSKNIVSILLSMIFLVVLTVPSIISVVDDSIDISILHDSGEEEEKGSENSKELELLFSELNGDDANLVSTETKNNLGYYFKSYPKPHLNLISPPPKQHIL